MMQDYEWTKEEAAMAKAVLNGTADAGQQNMFVKHLVEVVCGINRTALEPGKPDVTAFNIGKQWVARQLQIAVTTPDDQFKEAKTDGRARSNTSKRTGSDPAKRRAARRSTAK
jgi:hypothetical protein